MRRGRFSCTVLQKRKVSVFCEQRLEPEHRASFIAYNRDGVLLFLFEQPLSMSLCIGCVYATYIVACKGRLQYRAYAWDVCVYDVLMLLMHVHGSVQGRTAVWRMALPLVVIPTAPVASAPVFRPAALTPMLLQALARQC